MQEPGEARLYRIHPAVAETGRQETDPIVSEAVDLELGDYWTVMARQGLKTEMQGGGQVVVKACQRGAPYLMRAKRWEEAAYYLEKMTQRDQPPGALAMALPFLREIAATPQEAPEDMAQLAEVLWMSRRLVEEGLAIAKLYDPA